MKKRLLPCLAVLFLLLTACGVGHMGVHALEDITDADIVANEMGYSAVLWQSYSDTFSCEASWESFRGVEYLWTLPGNEARTVHVTYAEQECGDYRVVLVLPDDTVVELEEGENTVEVPEGSTWMAVAAAGGDVLIQNVIPKHLDCITAKLVEMGVEVEEREDTLLVRRSGPLQKANVKTMPYPGFPTDMQPQITTVLCLAEGTSLVTESVWNNRYRYVDELKRMGASIQVDDKTAVVEGVDHLTGAPIQACDLRAGAALVIAALAAKGESEISCVQYIERGYEDIVTKLQGLGASIRTVEVPGESEELEAHIG